MVNGSTSSSSKDSITAGPARGLPNNVETTVRTTINTDMLDDSGIHARKRSRSHGGIQPSDSVGHSLLKEGVVETAGMALSEGLPRTSSSLGFMRELNDDADGTAAENVRRIVSHVLIPLPDDNQSWEPIKTKLELAVLL